MLLMALVTGWEVVVYLVLVINPKCCDVMFGNMYNASITLFQLKVICLAVNAVDVFGDQLRSECFH